METPNVEVKNVTSNAGNEIPNQFIIRTDKGVFFQSYRSIIAFKPFGNGKIILNKSRWDYSKTTGKYRNKFLNETKSETERKIENGTYKLKDFN